MSLEIDNPQPKPRRRAHKSQDRSFPEPKNDLKLHDEKMLEDLRQSIEKSDNNDVMRNNLFASDIPDKMEKRRRHRRDRGEGHVNPSFEPDTDLKDQTNEEENIRMEESKPHRRRRRKPRQDEMETNNEELSNQAPAEAEQNNDEVAKSRRRRRRAEKQDPPQTTNETIESRIITDPLLIEDDGRVLNIMIHRTDRLKTDLNVLHPMIRVHIMDISTGKTLIKQHRDRKVTFCNEDTEKVTTILPVMTQPFDFKSHRVTIPAWEESLIFNENAKYLIENPNIIYFFEVLDLNAPRAVQKNYPLQQRSSGFHYIAWAFLRPVSANGDYNINHKVRLQLYENGPFRNIDDPFTPNVFFWWNQKFRQTYPSTLYVTIAAIKLSQDISPEFAMRSMFPNQKEGAPNGLVDSHLPGLAFNKQLDVTALQQWKRLPGQMCHIPNVPQLKLNAGTDGANVLSFSPDGQWLACGAVENTDSFPVLLFDMLKLYSQVSNTFTGHKRIIHNLAWCHKSEFLASASADGTCRVWRIKKMNSDKEIAEKTDELENTSETVGSMIGDKRILCHPCFVYSVAFHCRLNTILLSAGYDKIIRIWDLSMNKKDVLHQLDGHKGFINCVIFSLDGRTMYSGDSKGEIHVWNVPAFELGNESIFKEKWTHKDIIAEEDLKGVVINHLVMNPTGKRLFVHSRDGSIRLIDLKIKTMILKFHGILNSEKNLRCCLSPCGSFLFSGSEDCSSGSQVFVWNAQTGDHVAIYKELGVSGPVSSIDYHPKCHMIAFTAVGNESSILVYAYSSEKAQFEMGYHSGNSNPGSPKLQLKQPHIHPDNMTKLDETAFRTRNFENDEKDFLALNKELERKNADRITRILNNLNTVTEVDRSLRSASKSMERASHLSRMNTNDGYISGPEEKGKLMRSSNKGSTLQSIPMTLNMTSTTRANFTFKPPPASRHKEQSNKYLGEVVALYDYQAQRSDEISFARGEIIKIVFRDGKNWLLGETSEGKQGYLPTNYVAGEELLVEHVASPREQNDHPLPVKTPKTRFKETDEMINGDTGNTGIYTDTNHNQDARRRRRRDSAIKDSNS